MPREKSVKSPEDPTMAKTRTKTGVRAGRKAACPIYYDCPKRQAEWEEEWLVRRDRLLVGAPPVREGHVDRSSRHKS